MFRSYLVTAYRNFIGNKTYSLINIFGLALGMAACFFIFHYIYFERSYDSFNKKSDRLYRVILETKGGDQRFLSAVTHPGVGPAMKEDYPEIESFARLVDYKLLLRSRELSYQAPDGTIKSFHQDRMFLTDESFFNLFSYPLIKGNPATCLQQPKSVLISASLAKKYFNSLDVLGKTMKLNDLHLLTVTGVFKDVPENSHIKFDVLVSLSTHGKTWGYNEFDWPEFYNYVLLKQGTDINAFEKKIGDFANKHMRALMDQYKYEAYYHLQRVSDIHLLSHYEKEAEINGSNTELSFLSIIGVFILIIAWINYINLSTAKSIDRSKEVGLRKVAGASSKQVFAQFLVESVVINAASLIFALGLIFATWPFVNNFLGKDINSGFLQGGLGSYLSFWVVVVVALLFGSLVIGIYPALILSSFTPVHLFKSMLRKSRSGIFLRKGLVAFQYILSIFLIAGALIVYKQLKFSREKELGYDIRKIVVVKSPSNVWKNYLQFNYLKTSLMKISLVDEVSSTSDIPGEQIVYQNGARTPAQSKGIYPASTNLLEIDEHFIPTYNVPISAGRNFGSGDTINLLKIPTTQPINVIINESLALDLGFNPTASAVNKQIYCLFASEEQPCNVVGVMNDYHQRSLKEKYEPILCYYPVKTLWKYVSIRLKEGNVESTLASVEKIYKEVFPESPFSYFFLDDYFNRQYSTDERIGKVFLLFSVLAIIVACLGLWGLSSFTLKLRLREIAIRKVLGASVRSLLLLLTVDYIKLALFVALLTLPVIFYVSHRWLENFAFHFEPNLLLFVIPSAFLLLISLATIFFQTLRTSIQTPTKSLKVE